MVHALTLQTVDGQDQTGDGDGMRGVTAPNPDVSDPKVFALMRRMYWARFSQRVEAMGIEHEDALQEVCMGLTTRSRSASRWNPKRGALSTWVYVAMNGMLLNLIDKQRRALRRSGSVGMGEDVALTVQAAEDEGQTVDDTDEDALPAREGGAAVSVDKRITVGPTTRAAAGGAIHRLRYREIREFDGAAHRGVQGRLRAMAVVGGQH
jgi:DNA-directed RNA polymerase specialized sigma24 family protein